MSTLSQATSSNLELYSTQEVCLQIEDQLKQISTNTNNGQDVIKGLTQKSKSLPSRYFYDDRGSQLFEQICDLPEYYPTRTEAAILQKYGNEVVQITQECELVELGSGSSTKTRFLLDAYQAQGYRLRYLPIDVSAKILEESAKQLLQDYPLLHIYGLVSTYEQALEELISKQFKKRMILFLGSTLGNFNDWECDRFFSGVLTALDQGDYFLLGIDLQKPQSVLEAAYNDTQGITAAFNLNMLAHLNKRFQGDFVPDSFEHRAFYNQSKSQIEMHLISKRSQLVHLNSLDLTVKLEQGETILTEISRKFNLQQIQLYLQKQGLKSLQVWTDPKQWFGLLLCQREFDSIKK